MSEQSNSPKLVFVDDGRDFLDTCNILFGGDHCVITFETAEKTMEFTRSLNEPAIFFVDMSLRQDGDGVELIRSIISVARAPVICYCLSGDADPKTKFTALSAGADGYVVKPFDKCEVDGYILAAERSFSRIFNATRDHLTGLLNRREFEKAALRELGQVMRWRRPTVCLFFDLDYFKEINDTHSHSTGDSVLQVIATCFDAHPWRSSDVVCRYGGDEFVILLPEITEAEARRIADTLKKAVASTSLKNTAGEIFHVSMSVGLAELNFDRAGREASTILKDLIERSDEDLKKVKSQRQNKGRVTP